MKDERDHINEIYKILYIKTEYIDIVDSVSVTTEEPISDSETTYTYNDNLINNIYTYKYDEVEASSLFQHYMDNSYVEVIDKEDGSRTIVDIRRTKVAAKRRKTNQQKYQKQRTHTFILMIIYITIIHQK